MLTTEDADRANEVLATPPTGQAWAREPGRLIPLAYKLARAVLREQPPGDELPFTVQWLLASFPDCSTFLSSKGNWLVEFTDGRGEEMSVHVPPKSTRGDVRRFLAWQGIVLEAARGEKAV